MRPHGPCEGMHDMMENILLGGFGTDMVYHGIAMHAQKFKKKAGQYLEKSSSRVVKTLMNEFHDLD